VNVNNIYIPKPRLVFVKPGTGSASKFIFGRPKDPKVHLKVRLQAELREEPAEA
jgi:hypothetical protein